MFTIAYAKLGFRKGTLIGLAASLLCLAFLGVLQYLMREEPGNAQVGYGFADDHVFGLRLILLALFVGLPAAVLLRHGRIVCLAGMLTTVALVASGLFALFIAALSSVKCLGSCS